MNVIKIQLDISVIKQAFYAYLNDLILRKNKGDNRYTKFDSENDVFLGILGEFAFRKFLYMKGFIKNKDYIHIGGLTNAADEDVVKVGNEIYDKYDFKLNLFFNEQKDSLDPLRIDVKTQKYVGSYNDQWQFAVNSKTIEKLTNKTREIDSFVFIFSRLGLQDIFDIDFNQYNEEGLLDFFNADIEMIVKTKNITLEIMGIISTEDFLKLSVPFNEKEVFRVNKKRNIEGFNVFKTQSPMHRINLGYLNSINKYIPSRVINKHSFAQIEEIVKNIPNSTKNVKLFIEGKELIFPYSKMYLNSQYISLEEMLNKNT